MLGFASSTRDNSDLVRIETTLAKCLADFVSGLCAIPPLNARITIDVVLPVTGIGGDELV